MNAYPSYAQPRRRRRRSFPLALMTCFSVVLVLCCAGTLGVAYMVTAEEPEPPVTEEFVPEVAEAQTFQQVISTAAQQARDTDTFSVTFTETQLSSWMALDGQTYALAHGYSFPFEDIQIGVDDGQFDFYGTLTTAGLDLPLQVLVTPYVDPVGHLDFTIDEAHLGGLPVPQFILDSLLAQVDRLLTQPIQDMRSDYTLDPNALVADNGTFSMRGTLN
jgi:uncharacterized protein YpmS